MRGRHGQFPEYHTSADDLDLRRPPTGWSSRSRSLGTILGVVDADRTLCNLEPYGEPQLGRRGLYRALGGTDIADAQLAMLWVLNQSDGATTLLDIAERSGIAFDAIVETAKVLEDHGLLAESDPTAELPPAPVEHVPRRRADEVALDAVLDSPGVDGRCAVDRLDRAVDVVVGVRVAHDERRHEHAAA